MKKMDKKAFTLIELIVVVAVVGILVLLGMPRFIGHKDKAELARIQHDVKVMEQEIGTVLIHNDDDFNKWEDNDKDFNQLIQENRLFEKEGIAQKVDSIDKTYKIIPEKYKENINTKLKGTFYANSDGKVYYEHEKPLLGIPIKPEEKEPGYSDEEPGYSDEEIDDLVKIGFIPVATVEDLDSIRSNTTRTYGKGTKWVSEHAGGLDKQYVQVANIDLSEYDSWSPIGTESSIFTGTYDGGSYVITDLEVKGDGSNHQGLFGRIEGATIRNVALEDINVTGSRFVGGLVGRANDSTIENSYATGSVTGSGGRVGGLVGQAWGTNKIANSYATGSVTGSGGDVGGLVGLVSGGTIDNSYATGSVTGSGGDVGGLVGVAQIDTTISNSYAEGSVEGDKLVGGLAGLASSSTIDNSYATGSVTDGNEGVGGLVGEAKSSNISNSYATGEVEGLSRAGGLVGWAEGGTISNSYATGSVTGIDSVSVIGSGKIVGGLAGYVQTGTKIKNSYATGGVTGEDHVGGLVGEARGSTVSNSYATGSVTGSESVGGLVGWAGGGTISNSYATGEVTGNYRVGGLLGYASSTISNSYWDKGTTKQTTSAGQDESFGKKTEEMKKADTYSTWNPDVWNIVNGEYPTLKNIH